MLSLDELKAHIHYNPDTGVFTRLVKTSNRSLIGAASGGYGAHGYYRVSLLGKRYYAHRLAWFYVHGEWPEEIDHVNGVRDDNRLSNLRLASRRENCVNAPAKLSNTSGFKNVSFNAERNQWMARGRHLGKRKNLGLFDTPEEAYQAWKRFAASSDGDFFNPSLRWDATK